MRVPISSDPFSSSTRTKSSPMSVTRVFVRTVTPSRWSCCLADSDRSGGYIGRIRSRASMSSIRASCGRIDRKSERSVSFAISCHIKMASG